MTHVVWDTFTPAGRLGTRPLPALNHRVGALPIASVLQYASSILGLAILLAAASQAPTGTAPAPRLVASSTVGLDVSVVTLLLVGPARDAQRRAPSERPNR